MANSKKNLKVFSLLILLGLGWLASAAVAQAQMTFGSIVGTVTDTSGAVIPNSKVTLTNTGTGGNTGRLLRMRKVTTNFQI